MPIFLDRLRESNKIELDSFAVCLIGLSRKFFGGQNYIILKEDWVGNDII